MKDKEDIAELFHRQTHRRMKWLLISVAIGAISALIFEFAEQSYPSWKIGVLVAGVLFFPFLIREETRKDNISRWAAIREIKRRL